jgi:hypothetical protein
VRGAYMVSERKVRGEWPIICLIFMWY